MKNFLASNYLLVLFTLLIKRHGAQDFVQIARAARAKAEADMARRPVSVGNESTLDVRSQLTSRIEAAKKQLNGFMAQPFIDALMVAKTSGKVETIPLFDHMKPKTEDITHNKVTPEIDAVDWTNIADDTYIFGSDMARKGEIFARTSAAFIRGANSTVQTLRFNPAAVEAFSTVMTDVCGDVPSCNAKSPYRTADGSCNNLNHPKWGMSKIPLIRELWPNYSDGIEKPRTRGVLGFPLASARTISRAVFHSEPPTTRDDNFAQSEVEDIYRTEWWKFLEQDIISTPSETRASDGKDLKCCSPHQPELVDRDKCFIIKIEQPDSDFNRTCINYVRSQAARDNKCLPGHRQQINAVTSYLDGSVVYGSSQEEQMALRSPISGELQAPKQQDLSLMHTLLVQEHNRVAGKLAELNPHWDNEKVFQEARKIVIAQIQHITYKEYLPVTIGEGVMSIFRLLPKDTGYKQVYRDNVDATIANEVAASAFRFRESFGAPGQTFTQEDERQYFDPYLHSLHNSTKVDGMIIWLAPMYNSKRTMEREKQGQMSLNVDRNRVDPAALSIQQGRDHGLQPYNSYRRLCHFPDLKRWWLSNGPSKHHTWQSIRLLKQAYRYTEDIDLYVGGLTERPIEGGIVGPTFACLIGRQFKRLQVGDRFYYENPRAGFSLEQVNEIKKTSVAGLLCDNTDVRRIQTAVFVKLGGRNKLVDCKDLPRVDLQAWREKTALENKMNIPNSTRPQGYKIENVLRTKPDPVERKQPLEYKTGSNRKVLFSVEGLFNGNRLVGERKAQKDKGSFINTGENKRKTPTDPISTTYQVVLPEIKPRISKESQVNKSFSNGKAKQERKLNSSFRTFRDTDVTNDVRTILIRQGLMKPKNTRHSRQYQVTLPEIQPQVSKVSGRDEQLRNEKGQQKSESDGGRPFPHVASGISDVRTILKLHGLMKPKGRYKGTNLVPAGRQNNGKSLNDNKRLIVGFREPVETSARENTFTHTGRTGESTSADTGRTGESTSADTIQQISDLGDTNARQELTSTTKLSKEKAHTQYNKLTNSEMIGLFNKLGQSEIIFGNWFAQNENKTPVEKQRLP